MAAAGALVERRDPEPGAWEMVSRAPEPRLRPYVRDYTGYVEQIDGLLRRRELPSGDVILIVNLGAPLQVCHPRETTLSFGRGDGFVAGLHDTYAITEAVGAQRGIEVRLTPIGAYLFLGLPMHAVANRTVRLEDVIGSAARELADRIEAAPSWDACFDLLDARIGARVAAARAPSAGVAHAWSRLLDTGGRLEIGALADEVGCSRKHLIALFRNQIGLPPKTVARIARFSRAVHQLGGPLGARWAEVAHESGYYDQAHLIRDFRQFTGTTPTDFLRRRHGDSEASMTEPPG